MAVDKLCKRFSALYDLISVTSFIVDFEVAHIFISLPPV